MNLKTEDNGIAYTPTILRAITRIALRATVSLAAPNQRMGCTLRTSDTDMPEVIRDDVVDAVIDAQALRLNPPLMTVGEPLEDWSALGMSDPVSLPPLELEF